ncbi:MAG: D-aminoacylase [Rhodospirillales bacterium]|nr:D-aminoacylase [Rhodospirillales bacterium]
MPDFDLVFRNATLIDGTGAPRRAGSLAVEAGRIGLVGDVPEGAGRDEIDLGGKALAPGFIDVHTHDDRALLAEPSMAMKASQGVTTVVVGNCGVSLAPLLLDGRAPPPPLDLLGGTGDFRYRSFAEYLAALDAAPAAVNAACLVGHSTLRVGTMDRLDRPATADEIEAMKTKLGEALDAGAVGMSSGLFYAPASAAPPAELESLAALLRPAGALYTTHMRDEGDHVLDSLDETFALGANAGVPVVVSHHKVTGRGNFGRTTETLPRIAAAQARQHVGLDAYPYPASSTVLRPVMVERAEKTLVTWSVPHPEATGRDLAELAREWGVTIEAAIERLQPAGAIYFMMDEADVRRVLAFPSTMIGSDGLPHDAHPHPRLWGTFPRVLGHYSREVGLFPLEEAVRKMTSLPAAEFGLRDRGRLAPGFAADLVVFDPSTVIDRATFEAPATPSAGIELVLVAGTPVWRDGRPTGSRPGRVLRRKTA